ncbi:MAG: hypothetical protein VXW17_07600, partial [Pseudomonadota bacterium]|nr:hypothetical protein [Pseudomonadota bacterium]
MYATAQRRLRRRQQLPRGRSSDSSGNRQGEQPLALRERSLDSDAPADDEGDGDPVTFYLSRRQLHRLPPEQKEELRKVVKVAPTQRHFQDLTASGVRWAPLRPDARRLGARYQFMRQLERFCHPLPRP